MLPVMYPISRMLVYPLKGSGELLGFRFACSNPVAGERWGTGVVTYFHYDVALEVLPKSVVDFLQSTPLNAIELKDYNGVYTSEMEALYQLPVMDVSDRKQVVQWLISGLIIPGDGSFSFGNNFSFHASPVVELVDGAYAYISEIDLGLKPSEKDGKVTHSMQKNATKFTLNFIFDSQSSIVEFFRPVHVSLRAKYQGNFLDNFQKMPLDMELTHAELTKLIVTAEIPIALGLDTPVFYNRQINSVGLYMCLGTPPKQGAYEDGFWFDDDTFEYKEQLLKGVKIAGKKLLNTVFAVYRSVGTVIFAPDMSQMFDTYHDHPLFYNIVHESWLKEYTLEAKRLGRDKHR